jgi:hypothetical protein
MQGHLQRRGADSWRHQRPSGLRRIHRSEAVRAAHREWYQARRTTFRSLSRCGYSIITPAPQRQPLRHTGDPRHP